MLLVPVLAHWLWDFSVFSGTLTTAPAESADAALAINLVAAVLVLVTVAQWRRVRARKSTVASPAR